MSEKDILIKEKMDHSGIFDFAGFYSYAHFWFKDHNYDGVTEEKYSEKVSGNTKDIFIEWKAVKRLSDYFKIEQQIKFEISGLTDVEVEIEGKRKKMNKGKIGVEVKGVMIRDPDSKWDKTPLSRFFREVYNKYVIPGRVIAIEEKIMADTRSWKEDLKSFLELTGKR